ncbi:MAG: MATE family efflux transporter [Rhodobacter sp.]|nr:MATE family efflux transporter [Rhodobacter sp.]MCY4167490.1 MATE family efflux transporter [Rhodobacter sp.]MCY4241347.1 MATE family efflux transporter [Rhodobacter sp.]
MTAARAGQARLDHRRVLRIAVPIMISNATVPILGAVDTGVVGQMGLAAPIGAVGIGAVILTAVYWIFGFLRMGTAGLASQARGAGMTDELSALLSRSLLVGLAAGVLLVLLQKPIFQMAFLISPASAEVETLARKYIQIRIWSAPGAIAVYSVTGWLIAMEKTGSVLVLQLWMNGVNVVLDLWFVLGLGWGVEGVAFATFLAEWSGFALGLWLCRQAFAVSAWRDGTKVFHGASLRWMASINRDLLIRSLLLETIILSFLFVAADFGDVTLAANQILVQFLHITAFALDGFAFAAETLVGQAMGARNRIRLRRSALLASLWGAVCVIGLSLVFLVFGARIIDLMATAPEVRSEARTYLGYMVLAPLAGLAAWMFDGIFIGATRAKDMRNMMAVSFAVYVVSACALVPLVDNHGLWLSLLATLLVRGITLGLRYPELEASADLK